MQILFVLLQFGTSMDTPLTTTQLVVFWGVVLLLVALFFFFLYRTNKIVQANSQKITQPEMPINIKKTKDVPEEEAAAIALAIHMYLNDIHDKESLTITLKKVSRVYSPWSSKIYTLRQNPR